VAGKCVLHHIDATGFDVLDIESLDDGARMPVRQGANRNIDRLHAASLVSRKPAHHGEVIGRDKATDLEQAG
jgi:hypothetical protein